MAAIYILYSFREDFLEIHQTERKIAYVGHVC